MPVGGIFARIVFWAALLVGFSYLFGIYWADSIPDEETALAMSTQFTSWKGSGVWLLAVYAALNVRTLDGWLIAAVMAFGALGDVLTEQDLTTGGMAFAVGHIVAIWLYFRNRRPRLTPTQIGVALFLLPITVLVATLLTYDAGIILYSVFLAAMAALAWTSAFPRYRTGLGAMLFVASDLLIFARLGPLSDSYWVDYPIWALYFAGQVLIVSGVVGGLTAPKPKKT
jgi:uncharacterized membrane protein YhhN